MNFNIETSSDPKLTIGITNVTTTDAVSTVRKDDEIYLLAADEENEKEVLITLTKSKALELAQRILQLIPELKQYPAAP